MNNDGLPPVRYSTRSTGPCECSATARPSSHSPTNCQTYKPDEGVAPANEQRVASIHHDERVGLTGRGTTLTRHAHATTPSTRATIMADRNTGRSCDSWRRKNATSFGCCWPSLFFRWTAPRSACTHRSGRQSVRRCSPRTAYAIGGNCASQPTGTCQCSSCRWPA